MWAPRVADGSGNAFFRLRASKATMAPTPTRAKPLIRPWRKLIFDWVAATVAIASATAFSASALALAASAHATCTAVSALAFRARRRRGYGPFGLGLVAASAVLIGKFAFESDAAMYGGLALLVAASLWNSWPVARPKAACPSCVTRTHS